MGKKEQHLTKVEKKRQEEFSALQSQLESEGYRTVDLTMTGKQANLYALVTPLVFVLPLVFGYLLRSSEMLELSEYLITFAVYLLSIVVHEGLHGITWACFAKKGWKSISFGFNTAAFAPYCTCNEPMSSLFRQGLAAFMPAILGIIPGIVALCTGSGAWFLFSVMSFFGSGGDFAIILSLINYKRKHDSKDILIMDHPTQIGTVIFEK